jgi:hypothetical protein
MDRFGQFSRLLDKASALRRPLAAAARLHRATAGSRAVGSRAASPDAPGAGGRKTIAGFALARPDGRPAAIRASAHLHHRIAAAYTAAMSATIRRGFGLSPKASRVSHTGKTSNGGDTPQQHAANFQVNAVAHRYGHGVTRAARLLAALGAHMPADAPADTAAIVQVQRFAPRLAGSANGLSANAGEADSTFNAQLAPGATSTHRFAGPRAHAALADGAVLGRTASALTGVAASLRLADRAAGALSLARTNSALTSATPSFTSDSKPGQRGGEAGGIQAARLPSERLKPVSRFTRMPEIPAMRRAVTLREAVATPFAKAITGSVLAAAYTMPRPQSTPGFAPARCGEAPLTVHLHMDPPRVTVNLAGGSAARTSTVDEIGHAVEQALRKANGELGHALVQAIGRELARRKRTEF